MGFGIFEDGFVQLVNPVEYEFAFDYIDKLLEPSIILDMQHLEICYYGKEIMAGQSLRMKATE